MHRRHSWSLRAFFRDHITEIDSERDPSSLERPSRPPRLRTFSYSGFSLMRRQDQIQKCGPWVLKNWIFDLLDCLRLANDAGIYKRRSPQEEVRTWRVFIQQPAGIRGAYSIRRSGWPSHQDRDTDMTQARAAPFSYLEPDTNKAGEGSA